MSDLPPWDCLIKSFITAKNAKEYAKYAKIKH